MAHAVLIAATRTGYSAHILDLPGCIATGQTLQQVKKRMQSAIEMHMHLMRADGDLIPEPTYRAENVEVAA